LVLLEEEIWYWQSTLQSEKPSLLGWILFLTPLMDVDLLKGAILDKIEGVPIGLQWKMIILGTQGTILKEQPIRALHVYIDELDVMMAKPLLMSLYVSKMEEDHEFP